jgi:hypothetical protein
MTSPNSFHVQKMYIILSNPIRNWRSIDFFNSIHFKTGEVFARKLLTLFKPWVFLPFYVHYIERYVHYIERYVHYIERKEEIVPVLSPIHVQSPILIRMNEQIFSLWLYYDSSSITLSNDVRLIVYSLSNTFFLLMYVSPC